MFEMPIYNINENHTKTKTILVKKKFTVYEILFKRLHLNKTESVCEIIKYTILHFTKVIFYFNRLNYIHNNIL